MRRKSLFEVWVSEVALAFGPVAEHSIMVEGVCVEGGASESAQNIPRDQILCIKETLLLWRAKGDGGDSCLYEGSSRGLWHLCRTSF